MPSSYTNYNTVQNNIQQETTGRQFFSHNSSSQRYLEKGWFQNHMEFEGLFFYLIAQQKDTTS